MDDGATNNAVRKREKAAFGERRPSLFRSDGPVEGRDIGPANARGMVRLHPDTLRRFRAARWSILLILVNSGEISRHSPWEPGMRIPGLIRRIVANIKQQYFPLLGANGTGSTAGRFFPLCFPALDEIQ
jgi:hypothetical protein